MNQDNEVVRLPIPQGELLGVRPDGIAGWAWNPATPHDPVEVEILVDGKRAGTARAELFDQTLAERGIGNGSHAFRCHISHIPSLPCRISMRLVDTQTELPGAFTVNSLEALAPAVEPSVRFTGAVDDIRPGRIHGWVVDNCRPGAKVRVALRDWKEPLCFVVADVYRKELEASGTGGGRCAFAIHIPVFVLSGRQHTLRVTVEDIDWELPGGKINFDEKAARALMEVIAPWRADVARIDNAINKLDELLARSEKMPGHLSVADRVRRWIEKVH